MEIQDNFKFLKLEQMKRKNPEELKEEERFFYILHLLDSENNPCRFFIFDNNLSRKIINKNFVGLQDVLINIKVTYRNDNWSVSLVDIN